MEGALMSHCYKDLIVWQKARMLAGRDLSNTEMIPEITKHMG